MTRRLFLLLALCAVLLLTLGIGVFAQTPNTGLPPLGTFAGGPFDTVNLANLDVHFTIPIFSRPGRGLPFSYALSYDSLVWSPTNSSGGGAWTPVGSNWGWRAVTEGATGYVTSGVPVTTFSCNQGTPPLPTETTITWSNIEYHDPSGGIHPIPGTIREVSFSSGSNCGSGIAVYPIQHEVATDNSGYIVYSNTSSATGQLTVYARGGLTVTTPLLGQSTGAGSVTDANGNTISVDSSGNFTDTLDSGGSHVLQVTGTPSSGQVTYTYKAPGSNGQGTPVSVVVTYKTNYYVQTCFQVPNINGYPGTTTPLVDHITLPDNTTYQFTYEETASACSPPAGAVTGRIASVKLPTGGTINYSYTGTNCDNNQNCMMADGSPTNMTREFTGGTSIIDQTGTWTYARAIQSGQQLPQTTTTVTDPEANQTVMNFSSVYELSQNTYTGSTVLDFQYLCYNNNFDGSKGPCSSASVTSPITRRDLYHVPSNGSLTSYVDDNYDTYGNMVLEYASGYGTNRTQQLERNVAISIQSSLCSSYNICDHPASVAIEDGGSNPKSYTNYLYDQGGNTHGSVTTVQRSVGGTSSGPFLSTAYTYYGSNGVLATVTDPNGTVTSYNGQGYACNQAFPIQVTVSNLTTTYGYNCIGGVAATITDPNGAQNSIGWGDPYYWRPTFTTDPLGNKTSFTYYTNAYSSGYPGVESVLTNSGGGTVVDKLSVSDAFGRPSLSQTKNPSAGTWDTVEYLYDVNGRTDYVTCPYAQSAGVPVGNIPSTGYSYDTLNRYTKIATFDGQNQLSYTSFSYNLNDVEVTAGPPSQGSSYATSRQYEYDAIGNLTSVCELTPTLGGSPCGQNSPPGNGYMTTYSYDPMGNLAGVNQSGQTRTYSYDGLSRMTSESNPESGTADYYYDSIGGGYCSVGSAYTSNGDLVAKADANGNHVCYWYDGLHRVTDVGNNSQSATNPCHRFRYDNSTGINGSYPSGMNPTPQYYWGRMVEAATDNCSGQTLTDEWFSYSARGEVTNTWESTPNSGGYYHLQNSYAANGPVSSRVGYLGAGLTSQFSNSFGYSFDGEGRPNGLVDNTIGKWIWSGTTYNPASQPNQVQFYSGDSETFSWDWRAPGSMVSPGSMLSWTSAVGAGPNNQQSGTLTWNANRTLYQMGITDHLNSGNTQTCTYVYDDLSRLYTAECTGTNYGQQFNYDAFGNINKTVPMGYTGVAFNPGAYLSGNRVPGFSYDSDGNVTNDGSYTYTYNVDGRAASISGSSSASAVYDALNRLVEVQASSNTQLVYAPDGFKFAYMNGQTVQKYIAPLVGGVQAVYTSATPTAPAFWRHSDWLGTVRLDSTPSQTMYFDGAYAPFGDQYAGAGTSDRVFTGQTQDIVPARTEFPFRQYSSSQSRWLVPDPSGMTAVDLTNPQTWNRYAYVGNNPLSRIDPLGLNDCDGDGPGPCPGGGDLTPTPINCNVGICPIVQPIFPIIPPGGGGGGGECREEGGVRTFQSNPKACTKPKTKPPNVTSIVQKIIDATACSAASPLIAAAQAVDGVVGTGLGGSAAFGILVTGVSGSASASLVADPEGNIGIAISGAYNNGMVPGVVGAGWSAGRTFTFADAQSIYDLDGTSPSITGSVGPFSATYSSDPSTITVSIGEGAGLQVGTLEYGGTYVVPSTVINCSQVF